MQNMVLLLQNGALAKKLLLINNQKEKMANHLDEGLIKIGLNVKSLKLNNLNRTN